jgi:hypothetical protein
MVILSRQDALHSGHFQVALLPRRLTRRCATSSPRASHLPRRAPVKNWVAVDEPEPQPGAHLGTPRLGYLHQGIYVGGGYVVHYAGYVHGLLRRPVEEVEIARFRNGRPLWVAADIQPIYDRSEVVQRARSRVGERRYRLLTNNCEHFCEWCLNGQQRSYQIEALIACGRRMLATPIDVVIVLMSRLLPNGYRSTTGIGERGGC